MQYYLNFDGIAQLLPQGPSFIFVDRVLEFEARKRIVTQKRVSGAETYFPGHFRNFAIMPGALAAEGIAQSATLLFRLTAQEKPRRETSANQASFYVVENIRTRFVDPIYPGDTLTYVVEVKNLAPRKAELVGVALVDGKDKIKTSLSGHLIEEDSFRQGIHYSAQWQPNQQGR